ncbi:hypothetical protein [Terrihalobacillus insolitus]|uniref:hypothetical protein n=1 Tax=Terrihalobacillus insolitus TaxID=2950438 RepID=UPI0023404E7A|nr:hypothetical protein [Terrihalobacillus insolitus]MDC3413954.1 hypothetical protein [Terrihalobacillus insolitus]
MVDQNSFQVVYKKIEIDTSRKVDYMEVVLESTDAGKAADSTDTTTPAVYFTDIMLQGGTVATSWVGHVSEIRWSFDTA